MYINFFNSILMRPPHFYERGYAYVLPYPCILFLFHIGNEYLKRLGVYRGIKCQTKPIY